MLSGDKSPLGKDVESSFCVMGSCSFGDVSDSLLRVRNSIPIQQKGPIGSLLMPTVSAGINLKRDAHFWRFEAVHDLKDLAGRTCYFRQWNGLHGTICKTTISPHLS